MDIRTDNLTKQAERDLRRVPWYIAEKFQLSQSYLSDLENNRKEVSPQQALKFAHALSSVIDHNSYHLILSIDQ